MHKSVYLAGPITGLSYEEATAWRDDMSAALKLHGITGVSPLRNKVYLKDTSVIEDEGDGILSTSRGIMTRDRFDATHCDVMFVNFLNTNRVSVGTCMEVAWADLLRKPLVLAMEKSGNLHDHCMVREASGYRVDNLDDAVEVIAAILGEY